ncbi:DUF2235 domain-containing protein [Pseudoalteromonas xiamenensis]
MKRLILCMDGTWNKPAQYDRGKRKPSNVVKMARGILPCSEEGVHQVVFYSEGVGTRWGLDKVLGGVLGIGLSTNVRRAYRFLVHNYQPGDEIYCFGFSRGAYTVRSVVGLIYQIGLLPKSHAFYLPEAYDLYRERAPSSVIQAFREKHQTRSVPIRFVGVWDTVGALGIPVKINALNRRYQFHNVSLTPNIEHAYQALAIDERRGLFKPAIWRLPPGSSQKLDQQWFAGSHSNVGGGYEKDGLANISLHWLKDNAANLGLAFDEEFLSFYKPCSLGEYRDPMRWYMRASTTLRDIAAVKQSNESIHPSVFERMTALPSYRPANLKHLFDIPTIELPSDQSLIKD